MRFKELGNNNAIWMPEITRQEIDAPLNWPTGRFIVGGCLVVLYADDD